MPVALCQALGDAGAHRPRSLGAHRFHIEVQRRRLERVGVDASRPRARHRGRGTPGARRRRRRRRAASAHLDPRRRAATEGHRDRHVRGLAGRRRHAVVEIEVPVHDRRGRRARARRAPRRVPRAVRRSSRPARNGRSPRPIDGRHGAAELAVVTLSTSGEPTMPGVRVAFLAADPQREVAGIDALRAPRRARPHATPPARARCLRHARRESIGTPMQREARAHRAPVRRSDRRTAPPGRRPGPRPPRTSTPHRHPRRSRRGSRRARRSHRASERCAAERHVAESPVAAHDRLAVPEHRVRARARSRDQPQRAALRSFSSASRPTKSVDRIEPRTRGPRRTDRRGARCRGPTTGSRARGARRRTRTRRRAEGRASHPPATTRRTDRSRTRSARTAPTRARP